MSYEGIVEADPTKPYEAMARRLVYPPLQRPGPAADRPGPGDGQNRGGPTGRFGSATGAASTPWAAPGWARRPWRRPACPPLLLDGDSCDRGFGGEGQAATRMEAFFGSIGGHGMSITYHVCKYTPPTELLTALGGPVRPAGRGPGELLTCPTRWPTPNLCGFGKSVIQAAPGRAGEGAGAGQLLRHHPQRLRHPQGIRQPGLSLPAGHPPQPGGMFRPARPGPAPGPGGGLRGLQGHPVRPGGFLRRLPVPSPGHRAPHRRAGGQDGVPPLLPGGGDHAPAGGKRHLRQQPAGGPAGGPGGLRRPHGGLRPLSAGPAALHAHDRQHRPPGPVQHPRPGGGGLPHPAILRLLRL